MKNLRSHFVFNRSQQNGIFILVVIIIILQLVYFFSPFSSEASQDPKEEEMVRQMQRSVDSLKMQMALQKDSIRLVPFNPNFISDYKGYMLGMSVAEIDRLHEFRQRDLWVNSAEEFQQVTEVSDSLLNSFAAFFKFPDFRREISEKDKVSKMPFSIPLSKADLNAASVDELRKVNGIGEKLSARIVNYRTSLGGFRGSVQLKDVYGLSPEVIERLLQQFEVKNFALEKLDINTVSVMQLVEIPYLNYEQARAIVRYREEMGEIQSFEELQQIKNFPLEKLDRIELYLAIDGKN